MDGSNILIFSDNRYITLISTAREEYFDQQIGYSHRLNNHEGLLSLGLWLQCAVQRLP